ncbi:MAG: hypothetical protein KKB20_17325 [Proteobacteria bacterium]|nr:hypothetical protein [Pseudomonadota bacterium]
MTAALFSLALDLAQGMALVKILVAVLMVVGLSLLAEHVSPRIAGVVSGYPLGAAISLFFIGYDLGPEFAARSAVYTAAGLAATQAFAAAYFLASWRMNGRPRLPAVLISTVVGLAGFFAVALAMHPLRVGLLAAGLLALGSILFFDRLLRNLTDAGIQNRVRTGPGIIITRALAAAVFIILVTSTARLVGPGWAGLFSAFPITMLPLIVIVHWTYRTEHVHTIIKNVPRGIGALAVYTLTVSLLYPRIGIYWGTLAAYAGATIYLVLLVQGGKPRVP